MLYKYDYNKTSTKILTPIKLKSQKNLLGNAKMNNSFSDRKLNIQSNSLKKINIEKNSYSKIKKNHKSVKDKFENKTYMGVYKENKFKLNLQENFHELFPKERNINNNKDIILNGNNIHRQPTNNKINFHIKNTSSNLMSMNGINISYSELARHVNNKKLGNKNNNDSRKNKHSNEKTSEKLNSSLSKNNIKNKLNISSKNLNINYEKEKININKNVEIKKNLFKQMDKKYENTEKKKIFSKEKCSNNYQVNLNQENFSTTPNNFIIDLKKSNYSNKNNNITKIKFNNNIYENKSNGDLNTKIKTNSYILQKININNNTNNYNDSNLKQKTKLKKNSFIDKKNSTFNLRSSLSFSINHKKINNNNDNSSNFVIKNENEIVYDKYFIDEGINDIDNKNSIGLCLSKTPNFLKNNLLSSSTKFFNFSAEIEGPECLHFFHVNLNQKNKNMAYRFENCNKENQIFNIFDLEKNDYKKNK